MCHAWTGEGACPPQFDLGCKAWWAPPPRHSIRSIPSANAGQYFAYAANELQASFSIRPQERHHVLRLDAAVLAVLLPGVGVGADSGLRKAHVGPKLLLSVIR